MCGSDVSGEPWKDIFIFTEDGNHRFLQNIGLELPNCTASHSKRPHNHNTPNDGNTKSQNIILLVTAYCSAKLFQIRHTNNS